MRNNKVKLMSLLLATIPGLGIGANATNYSENFNPAMLISWVFVLLIILFTFVIYILGKVLISSTKEKIKRESGKVLKLIAIPLIGLPFLSNAQVVESSEPMGLGYTTAFNFWYLLIAVLIIQFIIIITFSLLIRNNLKTKKEAVMAAKPKEAFNFLGSSKFWDRFNKAKEISEEKSILLDHDYDGIKELDNDLPPWWKYGFYLTIIWSVFYLFYYQFSDNAISSKQEYENEMAVAAQEVAAFKATQKENVDETTAVLLTEKADLDIGSSLYAKNCVACHAADGGGGIGPNFTDKYWIYKGSIKDVFKTIKYGAKNGMKSWENDFSPVEMQKVASYVLSLQGTTPADSKAPEGELYEGDGEESDNLAQPAADSTLNAEL